MTVTNHSIPDRQSGGRTRATSPALDHLAPAAEEQASSIVGELASAFGLTRREAALVSAVAGATARLERLFPQSGHDVQPTRPSIFLFGDVQIDTSKRLVTRAGEVVTLTPREYDLLVVLARGAGGAISYETLRADVWGGRISLDSRTIAQHVACLRKKLEPDSARPQHLLTVQRFGYRLKGSWSS